MNNHPKNIPLPDGEAAVAGLIALAQGTFKEETPAVHDAGLVRFERSVARRTLRRRGRGVIWALGLGAATAAVVALGAIVSLPTLRGQRSLTFDVVNATVGSGGYVRANVTGNADVRFSDGSSLTLDPSTGARVGDFDAHGGRVLLESGRARVRVNPLPHANWTVDAGPYSVHVIGTEFDIRWSANEEVLDVHLLKGAIVVRGPLARDGLSMEAGAHLFANVRKGEIHLDGQPAGASSAEAPAAPAAPAPPVSPPPAPHEAAAVVPAPAAPAVASAPASPPAPRASHSAAVGATHSRTIALASPHAHAPAPETGWSARLGRGDFQGIIGDAEHRGLDTVFTTASPSDLNALADAARFARRGDVAHGALIAERTRFPGSSQGRDAAFFLGGLAEDEPGSSAMKTALDWYERYLRESPNGTFVRPVLGRRMVLVQKLRGSAAARPLAAEYLERFADGPYAGNARKLLETR
jgi:ferric-dicitrate binding protein FerR (iron transport regulator)